MKMTAGRDEERREDTAILERTPPATCAGLHRGAAWASIGPVRC